MSDAALLSAYPLKARILGEMKCYDEALQAAEAALPHTAKPQNPAPAKASVEKLIAELKKQKG